MPWLLNGVSAISIFLIVFFTGFNVLEATLPSLISKCAPPDAKGTAIGIYSSIQFIGTFVGAAGGGFLYQHFGRDAIIAFDAVLLGAWFIIALSMRVPGKVTIRVYSLPVLDRERERTLIERLQAQRGVRSVELRDGGRTAQLKVELGGFDEKHVMRLIEGEI
jgi:MFS family permease